MQEAKDSDDPSTSSDEDAMDTSETLAGKGERAPVAGVMDSNIPALSIGKKSRLGDLHVASVMDEEEVRELARRRRPEIKAKINTQTRVGPGASGIVGGGGPVLPARVAEECSRILGQGVTESEERAFSDLARMAKVRELEAWEHFRVSSPAQPGTKPKDLADTRWVLAWEEVGGERTVKARLVAKGYQGNVDIAGCVSRRSPHLRAISLGALMKWPQWNLDTENAFLQAGGFDREVHLRAPFEWNSNATSRVWKLRNPLMG